MLAATAQCMLLLLLWSLLFLQSSTAAQLLICSGASDDVAEPPKLSRRRNRGQQPDVPAPALSPKASASTAAAQAQQPTRKPQQAADAAAKQPSKAESAAAAKVGELEGMVKQTVPSSASNAVPDKQKPAKRKGSNEQGAGQAKSGEQGEQPKQQQRQADVRTRTVPAASAAAQGFARNGPSHQPASSAQDTARGSEAALQSEALPSPQQQPQKSSQQQQRHTPAAQPGTRPAPPPANPPPTRSAAASRGSARPATNYSAAVSGLVQNTAALNLSDSAEPSSAAQPNGVAASLVRPADPPSAVPAAANAALPVANQVQSRKQQQPAQQQGRQQQQKQPQQQQHSQHLQQPQLSLPAADAHVSMPQYSAQQQQQQQQQGYVHKPAGVSRGGAQYPWDMPLPPVSTPHPATHLHIPNVDWSFHAPAGAAAPGPAPGFSRTASAGNLANAWPQHGTAQMLPPPTNASAHQAHAASSRGDSFDSSTQRTSQAVQQPQKSGNRASTSGFVVASPPGRPGQNETRAGQTGNSVRPSAGILSVQMNTAGHSRPPGSHAQPASAMPQAGRQQAQAQAQAPYSGMGSSGQNMGQGVSLPSSIANNIWAVGEGNSDSQGTSAEQRPHMWASPSRNSPLRRAGEFSGHGIARQPSLSQATEIRRVAEASGLCCPITKDLMSDPVVLISDGYTYERAAITKWLERNETSPITKAPLQHKDMVPNLTMRSAIQLLIPSANSQRLFSSQLERRHI